MPNVLIVTQARTESTRFPSKVLKPLLGQPVLLHHLDRLRQAREADGIVVATPDTPENEAIHTLCTRHGYRCMLVPGNPQDVLARFYTVAEAYDPAHIVRVTSDCPLVSAEVIDGVIQQHLRMSVTHGVVFTGLAREWGDGFDVECFTRAGLIHAHKEATAPSAREHVGAAFYQHRDRYRIAEYPCPYDLSWLRLSVDTPDDLDLVERILGRALERGYRVEMLSWRDLMILAQHPPFRSRMQARPMNGAYIAQVTAERGAAADWQALRYGQGTGV